MNGLYGPTTLRYPGGTLATNQAVSVWTAASGGSMVPLWQDAGSVIPLANPTQTDEYGNLSFWAQPGSYWLEANGDRFPAVVEDQLGSGAASYSHHQSSAAAVWNVPHNLGVPREPTVLLDSAPTVPVIPDVEHTDGNNTVLIFPSPASGWAYFS